MCTMLKICGLICIFAACYLTGLELDRSLKRRWLFFREMKDTLLSLEQEMTWYRTPLPETLKRAASVCKTPLRPMLLCCAGQMEARGGQSFEEIWKISARNHLPGELMRSDAEYQALLEVAGALSCEDVVMQKTYLQQYQQRFDGLSDMAYQEWQERGALYRRLAAAFGAAAVIILL